MKPGFTLVESLISLLIISAVGMCSIYVANGMFKNALIRDNHNSELVQNIDMVEKIKSSVKTKDDLQEFSDNHANVSVSELSDKLFKVVVGGDRRLTIILRLG